MSNNQWQGGQQPPHQPPVPQAPPGAMPQQGHPQQGHPQQGHPQQPQHGFQQPQHQQVGYPQGQPQGGYQQPGPGQAYAQQGYPQQMPVKKKSKAPAIIAGVLALALLAGGGFLAWYFLKGSPTAGVASQGLPADVLGVVEINLNPPAGDKLAVKELAEKFPAAKDKVSEVDGDYKKALWNLIPDSEDKPDYEELKPWLGDSVAVGFLPAEGSNPRVIGSVQITDKAKAEEFAKKHLDNVKVQFTDTLMVVTDDNDSFDVASVKDNSLAQNETYKKDLGKLSGSYLVTGWMSEAGSTFVTEQSGAKSEPAHGAMGMKVEDKAAVLHTVGASSGEPVEMSKGAREFLAGMPDLGYGGLSLAFNDQTHQMLWDALKPLAENQGMSLEELGITSVDDLKALLGTRLATTLDFPADGSEPRIAVKVETPDPAKHQELLKKLSDGAVPIEQKVDGNVVLSTVGISPDEASNPSAKLGDLEGFKQNTKGEGDSVIFFVDAPKILATFGQELPPEVASNLEPISGLGISGGDAGDGYSEFNVRVGTK